MRGIRTLDPSCGPQPSNPFRKSSPAAAALWNKSNPVARAQNLESETKYLSSYFADTALASLSLGAGVFGLGCTMAALAPGYWWFAAALAVSGAAGLTLTNGTNSIMQLSTEP